MDQLPNSHSLAFVEEFYESYLRDPASVPSVWRRYFEQFPAEERTGAGRISGPSFCPSSLFDPSSRRNGRPERADELSALQHRVDQLIRNFRVRGHIVAHIDPLRRPRSQPEELDPKFYGFTDADMERFFSCETIQCDGPLRLREIIERLRNTYCRSIGVQFMHIDDLRVRMWLQERMEGTQNRTRLTRDEQIRILTRLTDAVVFEEFIRKKYLGAKTFSLEGAESLIPLLDLAVEEAGAQGIDQIVLGMAHRGRLNVLANIIGQRPREIFRGFEDRDPELHFGRDDVMYHLGYSNDYETATGRKVHLSLCFNPSHLEFVGPVALGRTRAKRDRAGNAERDRSMALLIHGDASFIGEGVVQETLNLSQLDGYTVGGTLHVIVNNQIGFTTSPEAGRSSTYSSDVAKMLQIPIFHVNGEDPEAVAQVIRLSMEFRHTFQRDVVIDMYAYRKLGHNEGDEPSFTQPLLYQAIDKREPVAEGYLEHLLELDGVKEEVDRIAAERREELEKELSLARNMEQPPAYQTLGGIWEGYCGGPENAADEVRTSVGLERLSNLIEIQTRFPEGFQPHPKIARAIETRQRMAAGERPLDWSAAESLALASLATEGYRIRLTGQDTERGTFSQRHAVLHDYENGETYIPLQHLASEQAPVEIRNSPLSECGALGFEYGYSLDFPESLTLWEAQFGDFSNAAQVIIDQFITSAEDKWRRLSGIVLLLPHGFEGMGPEHSSARLERFLQLAAEDNIQVVYPTTPAQYFHCLRRQALRRWRKPLVIMTPKSLLRHPGAVSSLEQLANGGFERILPDDLEERRFEAERVLLCSGKIYYALAKRRQELERGDVAILRLEQLYPLPDALLRSALASYRDGTPVVWAQEEPENMGAWRYLRVRYGNRLFDRLPLSGIYRPESASPATGSKSSHKEEEERLLAQAFEG